MGPITFSLEETNNLEPNHLEQMPSTTVSEVQSLPGDFGYNSLQNHLEPTSSFTQKLVFDYKLWNQSMNKIILIDSKLPYFTNYTNSNTFPIIYDRMCSGDQLIELLTNLYSQTKIQRIAIVSYYDNNPIFLDNTPLFESSLITNIIKKFKIANIDFLACDTLNSQLWKNFYSMLHNATNVIVGASNDKTGNIKYGGDWIMESTSEDISTIYFNDQIQQYASLLDQTTYENVYYTTSSDNTYAIVTGFVTPPPSNWECIIYPSVIISDTSYPVKRIEGYVFTDCVALSSIQLPDGLKEIGSFAFVNCTSLTEITIPNSVILFGPGDVRTFQGCTNLVSCILPDNISFTTLGNSVFEACPQLKSIDIPRNITYIDMFCFSQMNMESVYFLGHNIPIIGPYNNGFNNATAYVLDGLTLSNIDSYFNNGTNVKYWYPYDYIIDSSNNATITQYKNTPPNWTFVIPAQIIDASNISHNVTSIANSAFSGCSNLITILVNSDNLTNIGNYAFHNCSSLMNVYFYNSIIPTIGSNNFDAIGCSIKYINGSSNISQFSSFPNAIPMLYPYFNYSIDSNNNATITSSTYIPNNFSLNIPDTIVDANGTYTVKYIADNTFKYATKLSHVILPNSIETIGNNAFQGCTNLLNINIPSNITFTTINDYMFQGCSRLSSIIIPNSITRIGGYVFTDCVALSSIQLPDGLKEIGSSAFVNCTSLTEITIPNSVILFGPGDVRTFQGCANLVSCVLPDNISFTELGNSVFEACPQLKSIDIPRNITFISSFTFYNTSALESVYFLGNIIPNIGPYNYGFNNATAYILQGTNTSNLSSYFNNGTNTSIFTPPTNHIPSGGVTILGIVKEGQTLTANNTLADIDGLGYFSYQWDASGVNINGATSNTYTLTSVEVGKKIRVTIKYSDGQRAQESILSAQTAFVEPLVVNQQGLTLVSLESPVNLPTVYEDSSNVQIEFIRMLFDLSYNDDTTDESIDAFVVKSVDSGSLKIGNSNWDAITNNIIDASHSAYWTPTLYTNGLLPAFKVAIRNTLFTESTTIADVKIYVTHVNHIPSGNVTISGIVEQGRTLTADTTSLVDIDGLDVFSYQWDISGVDISGATSITYTLTQVEVGKTVGVTIKYTDAQGTPESVRSAQTSVVANINDVPTGTVTISGIAAQYQVLTAVTTSLADIDGLGYFLYQWDASGVVISGATSSIYTLTENEIGKRIRVVVKYTDAQGTDEMFTSEQTVSVNQSPVLVSMESPINLPTVYEDASNVQIDFIRLLFDLSYNDDIEEDSIGSFVVKSVDSVSGSLKIGNSSWDASTNNIIDASNTAYWTPTLYTCGLLPAFKVSIRDKLLGESNTLADIKIAVTHVNHIPSGGVTITGIPKQGQTLTAQNNIEDNDGKVSLTYQWKSNDVDISGANTATLVLIEALVNKVINVVATYIDRYGDSTSISSIGTSSIENINDQYSGGVTIIGIPITGIPIQGQTLTATNNLDDPDMIILLTYKWQADGQDISGANTAVLILGEAQVNKSIKAIATYTDTYNNITSVSSTSTLPVENVNNLYTGSVIISNMSPIQTDTLIATNSLVDSDGIYLLTYQWKGDGVNISGATNATLSLRPAQINKVITVVATYLDSYGIITSVSSVGTESVQTVSNLRSGHVDISGIFTQGETLTATNTLIDYYGIVSFTYQWTADNVYISGASSITLVLGETMVNKVINVVVTYVNSIAETFSVSSTNTQSIANVNDAYSGSILLSGLAIQGETLTINNTLADSDGVISQTYQWKSNNVDISGATNNTLLLSDIHVNKVITVVVTYVDSYDVFTSVSSANEMVPETNVTFDSMAGTIIDGYISGANISIRYINGDIVSGINDVTSNAFGNFNILGVFPTPYYKIICSGGTDLATGQPLLYPLSIVVNNPSGSTTPLNSTANITPLTSIVSDIVTSQAALGQTINIAAATLTVATALGINVADIGVDYLATNNTSIAKAAVKIATIVSIIATSTSIPVVDIAKSISTIISTSTVPLVIDETFVINVVDTAIPAGNATPLVDENIITLVTAVSSNVNTATDLTSIYKASIGGTNVAQILTPTTNVSTVLNTETANATIGVLVPVIPGSVVINGYVGSPREGDVLTAVVTDGNGLNGVTISYFWYANNSRLLDIPITSQTLPLLLSYVGQQIKVQVTYTDNSSSSESVMSSNTPTVLAANLNYTIINSSSVSVTSPVSLSITSVNIPSKIYISGTIYNVTSIGDNAFQNCTNLVSITIPSSVTSIGDYAFHNCKKIISIQIPSLVETINTFAFNGCELLSTVIMSSNSVKIIKGSAFQNCISLQTILLPDSLQTIEYNVFIGCILLTTVTFGSSITRIEDSVFYNCSSLKNIDIPNTVTYIGSNLFLNCINLTNVSIGTGITRLTDSMFMSCSSLSSITIPNTVNRIDNSVFQESGIITITIPSSVNNIGTYNVFYNCISLTNIIVNEFNQSYSAVDGVLFNKNKTTLCQYPKGNNRTSYTIPNTVTTINSHSFSKCNLTSITIQSLVNTIQDNAFDSCTLLNKIYFQGNTIPSSIGTNNFNSITDTAYYLQTTQNPNKLLDYFTYIQMITLDVSITIKGTVIDGYIKNSTITIKDLAGVSHGTTTSDQNGNYTLPATLLPNTTYIITCVGGIDIATILPLTYPLSCVYVTGATVTSVTNININPLTTMVATLVAGGQTLPAATANVSTALGISEASITSDYIGVPNTSVAVAAVKVATLISTLVTATAAAGYTGAEIVTAVAQTVGAQTGVINFTQLSLVTSVVTSINTNNTTIAADISIQTVTNISAVISQVSTSLDVVKATGANSITDLTNIYKTSIGAQTVVTTNVSTINSVTIPNVSTAITTAISTATVGQIKSNICFKAGTKIVTDQGIVNIEQITEQNSIRGKKVLYVSKTKNISDEMILIKKGGLYESVPNVDTYITEEHKIFYNREMIKVKHLVNGETIIRKKMRKEIVYNVLLEGETSGKMIANGLISETLDPRSPMVKLLLTLEEMSDSDKEEIIMVVNKKMKKEHEKRKKLQ